MSEDLLESLSLCGKSLLDLMQEKTWITKNIPDLCGERRDLKKRRFEAVNKINKRVQRPSRKQRGMK